MIFKKLLTSTVNQSKIAYLQQMKIPGVANTAITGYLINRKIKTYVINGDINNKAIVKKGVPQRSVLGPLLYLSYTNNIHNVKLKGR